MTSSRCGLAPARQSSAYGYRHGVTTGSDRQSFCCEEGRGATYRQNGVKLQKHGPTSETVASAVTPSAPSRCMLLQILQALRCRRVCHAEPEYLYGCGYRGPCAVTGCAQIGITVAVAIFMIIRVWCTRCG